MAKNDITTGPENLTRRPGSKIRNAHISANAFSTFISNLQDNIFIPHIANVNIFESDGLETILNSDVLELPITTFNDENTPFVLENETIIPEPLPKNYKLAISSPNSKKWINAMEAELMAHEENGTFEEVQTKLQGYIALGCRWVFALKKELGMNTYYISTDIGIYSIKNRYLCILSKICKR